MRILVLAGGPSVREALELVPADWPERVISANEHGFYQDKFKVDYIAFSDAIHARKRLGTERAFKEYNVPTISYHPWADFVIKYDPLVFGRSAGFVAVYAAATMGSLVAVAGVDCTHGTKPYFWQKNSKDVNFHPGSRSRGQHIAEMLAGGIAEFRRMPSMTAFKDHWEVFGEDCLHTVRR